MEHSAADAGRGRAGADFAQAIISVCGSSGLTRTGTTAPGWKLPIAIRLTACVSVAGYGSRPGTVTVRLNWTRGLSLIAVPYR